MSLTRDDLRAAVSVGTITEAQAASFLSLSDVPEEAIRPLATNDGVVSISAIYGVVAIAPRNVIISPAARWMPSP